MRRFVELTLGVMLPLHLSACGGAGASGGGTGLDSSGLPLCGADPAAQPARCVDSHGAELCKVDTGYAGDGLALCDMEPDKGFTIHFGPKDYADPEEVSKYLLEPGGEQEFCLNVNTPNTTEKFFDSYHGRMRPNSHHLIVTMPAQHVEDDASPWPCTPAVTDRWLFGSQASQIDVGRGSDPVAPQPGDPDYGLAHDIPPAQTLRLDFHNVNSTDRTQLREAWTSVAYVEASDVRVRSDLIGFYNVGIKIPPMGFAITSRLRCDVPKSGSGEDQTVYLGVVTGHAHRRLKRFSVWHEHMDGSNELVYETTDWHEPGNALYRRGIENPSLPIKAGDSRWGAKSGYLQIQAGEAISFECAYQNDLPQTVTIGETSSDEMCNVFGDYFPSVGGMWNCFGS